MMRKMRKWCAAWLSLAMALLLAVPTLAASAENHTVLNVRFAPNGTGVNSTAEDPIVYTAYRIADISVNAETGKFMYTPAPGFDGAKIDINAVLNGAQANENLEACKELLAAFGNYINENAEAIKAAAGNGVRTAETENQTIGTENTSTDGVAQFTDLADGLYVISTNASVWIGNTHYTPYPLLVGVPYVYGDVANRYLTATAKFNVEIPVEDPDNPPPPDVPDNPPPLDAPGNPPPPSNIPDSPPAYSNTPNLSDTPAPTVTPPALNEIEMEDVPLAAPEVEILSLDVPLVDMLDDIDEAELELLDLDMDVPLAYLPQTGLLWWPVPLMAAAGVLLVTIGALLRRKAVYDE